MKIKLNPYRENGFMFIDKELGVCLALDKPIAVIDDEKITRSIKSALKAKTIIEIVEDTPNVDEGQDESIDGEEDGSLDEESGLEESVLEEASTEEIQEEPKKTRKTRNAKTNKK